MTAKPGYLLPDGDAYTDDLACTLVFYPDKEEYRRALLGSIVYLSNWLAWERDDDKRGKDAARAWKNAIEQTLECWTMACFEELMADVARIRDLLETKKDCCDDNVSYYPTEEPSTDIEPGVGDPPTHYGETAISDWDDWEEHVCYNAHAYVDFLISTGDQLFHATQISSIFLGVIAAALALLAFSGIGLPIAFGLAASVVSLVALSATALTFADTDTDFEDARDAIVCAIVKGYSLPDAIEAALGSDSSWDLFYQFVDFDSALAIIYEGGYGSEYLPTDTRDDCTCEGLEHFKFTFDSDTDGFVPVSNFPGWDAEGNLFFSPSSSAQWQHGRWWTWDDLETRFSLSLPFYVDQVRFRLYLEPGSGSQKRHLWQMRLYGTSETVQLSEVWDSDNFTSEEWHDITWNLDTPILSGDDEKAIQISVYRYISQTGSKVRIDDIGYYLK